VRKRLFEPEPEPIPEDLREAVELWLAYKRQEHRQTYKPMGLRALVERLAAWGPERAMAAVKFSMSNTYKGVFEEKKPAEDEKPFCTPEQLAHVKRMVDLSRPADAEPITSPVYFRKVFEGLEPAAFDPGYIAYVKEAYERRRG
jgi:hypothetical protein